MDLPPCVDLLDLGSPGLGLVPYITGSDAVMFVDAVHDNALPRTASIYSQDRVQAMPGGPRLSPHDPAVKAALLIAGLAVSAPAGALLVAVTPEDWRIVRFDAP